VLADVLAKTTSNESNLPSLLYSKPLAVVESIPKTDDVTKVIGKKPLSVGNNLFGMKVETSAVKAEFLSNFKSREPDTVFSWYTVAVTLSLVKKSIALVLTLVCFTLSVKNCVALSVYKFNFTTSSSIPKHLKRFL